MLNVLVGVKKGMTQIFSGNQVVPTSLIEFVPNTVLKVEKSKNSEKNYIFLAYGKDKNNKKIKKSILGQLKGSNTNQNKIKQFTIAISEEINLKKGDKLKVDNFKEGAVVLVKGFTKGRGFQGVIKRHGFSRGPESHGSHHHRRPGSIGMCSFPAKVLKGKKMPGRMGSKQITIKNLKIVKIDVRNNLIYLKGSIPGAIGNYIAIKGNN